MYDCGTCIRFWRDEKDHMGPNSNVFFIHLHREEVDDSTKRLSRSAEYQFKKALSSMRNSGGGALFVHTCKGIFRHAMVSFQPTVDPIFHSMLTDDEMISDGFRWKLVEYGDALFHKIDVLPSETFITADLKTKLLAWCVGKHVSTSIEKLRPLLMSKRKVSTAEPTVQGLLHMDQADVVKIYLDKSDVDYSCNFMLSSFFCVSTWVNNIINGCSLPEYVTSVSKRKQGGSVYVGQTSTNSNVDMDGVPFPFQGNKHELQKMLSKELQKEIAVFKNRYSDIALKPKDVFQIEIHDTGTDCGIIEVAVRPVNGCVFTDALGPASFRIENKFMGENQYKTFVRLPFDEWGEMASGCATLWSLNQ
ncbi:uncharacterized protein LOC124265103 [Haliotis rubra]|uniref:uncharacterized protein LOC124265103 n=1 Tax=Haliotis rubra TaxID=36100 RepID=UPI001EE5C221|nr:uncharacterized protein LOC124265103 [Haliotis rubra]